jgi:hypothetical protein
MIVSNVGIAKICRAPFSNPGRATVPNHVLTFIAAIPILAFMYAQPALSQACVIFYEGNGCTQSRSSCCTEAGPGMNGCWSNDEARSMEVVGPSGTVVSVFDSPSGRTNDDYFVLEKTDDNDVCVSSFENPTLSGGDGRWFYSGGNGLDGKVSTFRWHDPR